MVWLENGKPGGNYRYKFEPGRGWRLVKRIDANVSDDFTCYHIRWYDEEKQQLIRTRHTIDSTNAGNDYHTETNYFAIPQTELVKSEKRFANGRLVEEKSFSVNQQLIAHSINGEAQEVAITGMVETMLEEGVVELTEYANGQPTGRVLQYHPNGKPKMQKAVGDGVYCEYDTDGSVTVQVAVKNGKREGKSQTYYDNGSKWRMYTYANDELHGPWEAI